MVQHKINKMIRLIKKAEKPVPTFNIGDKVYYVKFSNDGRMGSNDRYEGTVVKVNRVTVDVELESGSVYRVDKVEVKSL
jgi:ribosomal protein L19